MKLSVQMLQQYERFELSGKTYEVAFRGFELGGFVFVTVWEVDSRECPKKVIQPLAGKCQCASRKVTKEIKFPNEAFVKLVGVE